jgi:hypothetical protein
MGKGWESCRSHTTRLDNFFKYYRWIHINKSFVLRFERMELILDLVLEWVQIRVTWARWSGGPFPWVPLKGLPACEFEVWDCKGRRVLTLNSQTLWSRVNICAYYEVSSLSLFALALSASFYNKLIPPLVCSMHLNFDVWCLKFTHANALCRVKKKRRIVLGFGSKYFYSTFFNLQQYSSQQLMCKRFK